MLFAGKTDSERQSVISTFETLDLQTGIWSVVPAESLGLSMPSANNIQPLEKFRSKEGIIVFSDTTEKKLLVYDNGEWVNVPRPHGRNLGETFSGLTAPRDLVCGG